MGKQSKCSGAHYYLIVVELGRPPFLVNGGQIDDNFEDLGNAWGMHGEGICGG
jgi:hypothetical protein